MTFLANTNHIKAEVAILISDKADFRARNMARDTVTSDERVQSSRRPNNSKYACTC